jgi:hypothetical protein
VFARKEAKSVLRSQSVDKEKEHKQELTGELSPRSSASQLEKEKMMLLEDAMACKTEGGHKV